MKKLSRLTALLCALLLCLSTLAAAEVLPLADTLSSYEAALSAAQEQQEEQAAQEAAVAELFESFMTSESFAELYVDKMLPAINDETGEGLALMQAFTEEQIGALANRIRELYGLIENPTQEDEGDYEDALLTLTMLDNGSEKIVYAIKYWSGTMTGTHTLNSDTVYIDGQITVSGTLTIKGTGSLEKFHDTGYNLFYVPSGATLIIEGTTDKNSIVVDGTDQAYAGSYSAIWNNGGTVEISKATIKDYKNSGDPGGFCYNSGSLTLNNTVIDNCDTTNNGGAIANYGTLSITNSTIMNCDATGEGGAIWDIGESLTISDTTFTKCSADSSGGAILFGDGTGAKPPADNPSATPGKTVNATLTNVTIDQCSAKAGSAIMLRSHTIGTVNMTGCTVQNCTASIAKDQGGAIRTNGGVGVQLTLDDCDILNNTNSINGGGIYWNANRQGAMLTVKNSQIIGNKATERGGGVFLEGANMSFENTIVSNNTADTGAGICVNTYGGGMGVGMSARDSFTLTLGAGCEVKDNTADYGAGVALCLYSKDPAEGYTYTVNIADGAKITENTANVDGGGVWIKHGNHYDADSNRREYNTYVNITGGEVFGNTAGHNGGAIYVEREFIDNANIEFLVTMSGGTVKENTALNGNGGSIYVNNGSMIMEGGELIGKDTEASAINGGAVYVNGGNFTMTGGTIKDSKASADGGGVYVNGGKVVIGTSGSTDHSAPLLSNNSAVNGGGVAVANAKEIPVMHNGTMTGNEATQNGGAVYVTGKGFTLKNGLMTKNSAVDGGAVYVSGGTFTMENGTLGGSAANKNTATNGGAVYVANGDFVMKDGSISNNDATTNGGAVYMNGGNFTMHHGNVNYNKAVFGGAVHMAGTNSVFTMESGHMDYNTASNGKEDSSRDGDGGAIYAKGGTLHIGLVNCTKNNPVESHQAGKTTHHPIMTGNTASDCGGGIAIVGSGTVHFYCGSATKNEALYKGVGKNVFMNSGENGEFHLYNGADVGVPKDPDLVVIGGKLVDERKPSDSVQLIYYPDNEGTGTYSTGLATIDTWFNLPDGEYFFDAPIDQESEQEMIFVGWTAKGTGSASDSAHVRKEDDYVESGKQVHAQDNADTETNYAYDGNPDKKMHLYAIWAPPVSDITYVENVDFAAATNGSAPVEYVLKQGETTEDKNYSLTIPPLQKDGYIIVGWYLYQDEGQNANWGLEPQFKSGAGTDYEDLDYAALKSASPAQYFALSEPGASFTLPIGRAKFGDITLVADMVPAYGSLKIKKAGWQQNMDSNQTFVFHIKGKAKVSGMPNTDMTIVIPGNGETTIQHLPVGDYTVTEDSGWSWRYTPVGENPKTATIENPSETPVVKFTNTRTSDKWLDGNAYADNGFGEFSKNDSNE